MWNSDQHLVEEEALKHYPYLGLREQAYSRENELLHAENKRMPDALDIPEDDLAKLIAGYFCEWHRLWKNKRDYISHHDNQGKYLEVAVYQDDFVDAARAVLERFGKQPSVGTAAEAHS